MSSKNQDKLHSSYITYCISSYFGAGMNKTEVIEALLKKEDNLTLSEAQALVWDWIWSKERSDI